ncbi:MAG TPA: hypothetical protein VF427_08970 [Noviherbaspirillum sp.]
MLDVLLARGCRCILAGVAGDVMNGKYAPCRCAEQPTQKGEPFWHFLKMDNVRPITAQPSVNCVETAQKLNNLFRTRHTDQMQPLARSAAGLHYFGMKVFLVENDIEFDVFVESRGKSQDIF